MKLYPLRKAKLPNAEHLLPYLKEIDKNQYYSNNGKLLQEFEHQLAEHFKVTYDEITCTNSGTGALTLALLASNPIPNSYCILPSFTFIGSAAAVLAAGLIPWFVDVDLETWALSPEMIYENLKNAPSPIGAIMPVSPFGQKINSKHWLEFKKSTNIPVILDGAWCFDNASISELPFIISTHATKVFGTGEGGLILSKDKTLMKRIKIGRNFGMDADRVSQLHSANVKMSEYHAAIGLAELQCWPSIHRDIVRVAQRYRDAFKNCQGVSLMSGYDGTWATATMNLCFDRPIAKHVANHLTEQGIEARCCWATPCHQHPAYQKFPCSSMPNTEYLMNSVLNLPFLLDMTQDDILFIRDCTLKSIDQVLKNKELVCE